VCSRQYQRIAPSAIAKRAETPIPKTSERTTSVKSVESPPIVSAPKIASASPPTIDPMPSVAMKELTPNPTTKIALATPTASAARKVSSRAGPSDHPTLASMWTNRPAENPTTAATERSNSPAAKAIVTPRAMITSTDSVTRMDSKFSRVKKVSGLRTEKTAIIAIRAKTTA
jgi:hypothetical protein